jgi:hypothetical protein
LTGRSRIPGDTPRLATPQPPRRVRMALSPTMTVPRWKPGDRIIWRDCSGQYLRAMEDGQAHVLIGARTYLVPIGELRPA